MCLSFKDKLVSNAVLVNRATSGKPALDLALKDGKVEVPLRVYSQDHEEGVKVMHYLVEFRRAGNTVWIEKLIAPPWELEGHTRLINAELRQRDAQVLPGQYELRVIGTITPDKIKRQSELGTLKLNLSTGR